MHYAISCVALWCATTHEIQLRSILDSCEIPATMISNDVTRSSDDQRHRRARPFLRTWNLDQTAVVARACPRGDNAVGSQGANDIWQPDEGSEPAPCERAGFRYCAFGGVLSKPVWLLPNATGPRAGQPWI